MTAVPVRRHLRRKPIKIREATVSVENRTFSRPISQQRSEAELMREKYLRQAEGRELDESRIRQIEAWQDWRGWTLRPFVEHGDVATYFKSYDAGRYQGEAISEYTADGNTIYHWKVIDSRSGEVIKSGRADSLVGATRKADNVYNSLPYVAGWNAARKGKKWNPAWGEERSSGWEDYHAWLDGVLEANPEGVLTVRN